MRAMAQQVCVVVSVAERAQLAAIAADRNPTAQARRAGARRSGFGRPALGAAGRAKHRHQPADGVALAATLCRDGG
jgi:hypothetical protein